jgi:Xaa-Pro aminopeptidase
MQKMGDGIAILTQRVWDGKDFYYLTGFDEPEAICLLIPEGKVRYVLFVRPDDPSRTLWSGKRHGVKAAKEVFGADAAFPLDQFENVLPRYIRGRDRIFCSHRDRELLELLQRWVGNPTSGYPQTISDPTAHIHAMRLIKDAEEIRLLREAVSITCEALQEVMKTAEPGMYEYELEAILEYVFHRMGSPRPGFPSIVGSGPNTTILHYETNRRQIRDGDLVLMDVGAEVGRYTADVTRTFPVNGRFSQEQREVYEIVLAANHQAISVIAPGVGLYEAHTQALQVIREGLFRLGLITDMESDWQTSVWLMYNTNHWIGLDVHDVGGRGPRDGVGMKLRAGMVLTVEPGIYVGEHSLRIVEARRQRADPERQKEMDAFLAAVKPAVAKYMDIGVRIEDDVLVTAEGHEVLSRAGPKEIRDIESLMKQASRFDH